jgi:hypothetical protein
MKHILFAALLLAYTTGYSQIFINTGNPNANKYKEENTESTIVKDTVKSVIVKETATVKTPDVKVKAKVPLNTHQAPAANVAATPAPKAIPEPTSAAPVAKLEIASDNHDLPPNAEPGKCYARCYVADQYETKEETVIDKPVSYKTHSIPATYKTVIDTIVEKPASIRYEEIPAVYETVTEDVLVSPATQKWVKSVADASCLSANPKDCQVLCLQEVSAVYKKVAKKVVKTPAERREHEVPAVVKVVHKKVLDEPARTEQIEVPATYKKVTHKELVTKGGYSEWKEILCSSKLTSSKIIAIQKALRAAGYNPGALDDVFGAQTKDALIKYQKDKNLPVGNLNIETLKSLGVE